MKTRRIYFPQDKYWEIEKFKTETESRENRKINMPDFINNFVEVKLKKDDFGNFIKKRKNDRFAF